jgi:hypothetical protein
MECRFAGYGYHKYYKHLVLNKIDNAFNEGDPALNLASASHDDPQEPWYESSNHSAAAAAEGNCSMCFVPYLSHPLHVLVHVFSKRHAPSLEGIGRAHDPAPLRCECVG